MSEWDEIPVLYCSKCYSLKVLSYNGVDYCGKCGGVRIGRCRIDQWIRLSGDMYHSDDVYNRKEEDNGREEESEA